MPDLSYQLRVIHDDGRDGPWNMAVDEVLLATAADSGLATLRFYAWRSATLSLGYFQAIADLGSHSPSGNLPVVRRRSGGGALVHDRELTYSMALPGDHILAQQTEALYETVHQSLLAALSDFGVRARLFGDSGTSIPSRASDQEPFLCFQRRTAFDVVLSGEKICGSAQRRVRGAVGLHGGVLLARSTYAPELPGINELSGVSLDDEKLSAAWAPKLIDALGCGRTFRGAHTSNERAAAARLVDQRYANDGWTQKR